MFYKGSMLFRIMLSGMGFVTLFAYQNCAGTASDFDQNLVASNPVDVIDHVIGTEIEFAQEKIIIDESSEEVQVEGSCSLEQNGAIMSWKLYDNSPNLLERGHASCEDGAFIVDFVGAQEINCGETLSFRVNLGTDAKQIEIQKICSN